MNLEQLRTRLSDVVSRKAQLQDEMRALEQEITNNEKTIHMRQYDMEVRRFQEVEVSFRAEINRLQADYEDLKAWNSEISRGNLQLQTIKNQLDADNARLREDNHAMAAEIQVLSVKLETMRERIGAQEARRSRSITPVARQEPALKAEMDAWLASKFSKEAENEGELKRLAESLTQASWKELDGRVQKLLDIVKEMGSERERLQEQWMSGIFLNGAAPAAKIDGEKQMTPPASTHCVTDETSASPPPLVERETDPNPRRESQPNSPELKTAPEAGAKADTDSAGDVEMRD